MPKRSPENLLAVARVRRPFGIKGEMLLETVAASVESLRQAQILYVGKQHLARKVVSFRSHGRDLLLSLGDCTSRTQAEEFRGALLYVDRDQLPSLPEGTYYQHQLVGLQVVSEDGQPLGRLQSILVTGANDVYVIQGKQGEILLPAISSVVREVRLSQGRMVVRLPDGQVIA